MLLPHSNVSRPLGHIAQRAIRHAENRTLFLNSAAVGEHDACVALELDEIEESERLEQHDSS